MELVEVRIREGVHDADQDRQIFRPAAGHDRRDRDLLHGGDASFREDQADLLVPRIGGPGQHPLHVLLRRRHHGQPVGKGVVRAVLQELLIGLVVRLPAEGLRGVVVLQDEVLLLLFGQRRQQGRDDLVAGRLDDGDRT